MVLNLILSLSQTPDAVSLNRRTVAYSLRETSGRVMVAGWTFWYILNDKKIMKNRDFESRVVTISTTWERKYTDQEKW